MGVGPELGWNLGAKVASRRSNCKAPHGLPCEVTPQGTCPLAIPSKLKQDHKPTRIECLFSCAHSPRNSTDGHLASGHVSGNILSALSRRRTRLRRGGAFAILEVARAIGRTDRGNPDFLVHSLCPQPPLRRPHPNGLMAFAKL
jgi:hypothetical protein